MDLFKGSKTGKSSTQPRGKWPHKRNFKGETELHLACKRQDLAQVKALVNSGVDVNCPDFAGWTALHEAAATGDRAVVEVLLRAGAQVNARSADGDTPLHDAAFCGSCEVVKLLLQYGANPEDKNVGGCSALDVAESSEMRELLLSFQSSPAPGTSSSEPHCSTAPTGCDNAIAQRGTPKALALLLSEVQERLIQARGLSTAEKHSSALWGIHTTLTQALAQQHIEKDNLAHMYWSVPDCLRKKVLKSQFISLASAQAKLVDVIQKQMQAVEELVTLCNNEHKQSITCPSAATATPTSIRQSSTTAPAQGSKALTATLVPAQGDKVLPATQVQAQRNKFLTATLVPAQGDKVLPAAQVQAQRNKFLTATRVQAQGNKAPRATRVQAQGNKAPRATRVQAQGNKVPRATRVRAQGNKAPRATRVQAQGNKALAAALDVRLQNNSAGQRQQALSTDSTTAPSSTWNQPYPNVVQAQPEGVCDLRLRVEPTQSCGVEDREDREELCSPSLLDSGSEDVDIVALLMNLRVVHVIGDDELVPSALVDQFLEELLKEDSWDF